MKEIFNKPILEQLYELRKEDFEQEVYDKDKEIQNIERACGQLNEEILSLIRKSCKDKKTATHLSACDSPLPHFI